MVPTARTASFLALLLAGLACSGDEATTGDSGTDAEDVAVDNGDADVDSDADTSDTGDAELEADVGVDLADVADIDPAGLRVVTLNLRCLLDNWDDRLPIIVTELAALDPELIGFQEACAEAGADNLAELLSDLAAETGRDYHVERSVTHLAWDRYQEGIAAVSVYPFDDSLVQVLPGGVFGRKVIALRVVTEVGDVVFATTHLDHQSALARSGQIEAAITALDGFAKDDEVRVLTGDLNEGPNDGDGDVANALTEAGYVDTWAAVGDGPGLTMPSGAPAARIDYVWVDPLTSGVAPAEAEVILEEPVGGVFGSDHLGVAVWLTAQ